MAAEPFNTLVGYTVGIPPVPIIDSNGNVVTNVNGALALTVSATGIIVSGGGVLQSPGGASSITLNNNGANIPTLGVTAALIVTANANITGTTGTGIGAITAGATNTLLSNTVAGFTANVNNYTQFKDYVAARGFQVDTNSKATKVYMPTSLIVGADYQDPVAA